MKNYYQPRIFIIFEREEHTWPLFAREWLTGEKFQVQHNEDDGFSHILNKADLILLECHNADNWDLVPPNLRFKTVILTPDHILNHGMVRVALSQEGFHDILPLPTDKAKMIDIIQNALSELNYSEE